MAEVHVVHCVDTEGPLTESIEQTFTRLRRMFGVALDPKAETLTKLQRAELDLGGKEEDVARALAPNLLAYHEDWPAIAAMTDRLWRSPASDELRDADGRPWTTTWFCCDHVDYDENPQRRAIGYHAVFDQYAALLADRPNGRDEIELHFHPPPLSRRANSNATHWFANQSTLFQVIARRIIDRLWFPVANRPGFHVTRPDSHWFLEQFVPYDFANQALAVSGGEQQDVSGGRYGDWRRAPTSWQPYHPSHDDHQRPGDCRRAIFRCLNVGTRFRLLAQADVDQAFEEARTQGNTVLAFTDHDFRDVLPDCRSVMAMLHQASARYPDVGWRHSTAREAARAALKHADAGAAVFLDCEFHGNVLHVRSTRSVFGPQPFLAIKTLEARYLHDDFDWTLEPDHWTYTFDDHTIPLERLEAVGVAVADATGHACAVRASSGEAFEGVAR